jgi:hypothetical protein
MVSSLLCAFHSRRKTCREREEGTLEMSRKTKREQYEERERRAETGKGRLSCSIYCTFREELIDNVSSDKARGASHEDLARRRRHLHQDKDREEREEKRREERKVDLLVSTFF